MASLLLRGGTIITASGEEKADILIEDGIIRSIISSGLPTTNYQLPTPQTEPEILDVTNKLLFPGLIDCHVHFRDPGLTHKADMQSEATAARAGGVTTVCEMPNTIPPTVTIAALADKVRRASLIRDCDIRFFLGVTEPRHLLALRDVWVHSSAELTRLRRHCSGVKLYFDHSTGNQGAEENVIEETFRLCGELKIPLVAHCEDASMNAAAVAQIENEKLKMRNVSLHSEMRPPESEERAIDRAIMLASRYGTPLHIAHLSTKGGLQLVRDAKKDGISVTCEVAPHHLLFTVDDYEKLGTLIKVNPPVRSKKHQAALWEGIADGTIDCIATDHAPHILEEKQVENPLDAPSGIPSVEVMLPLLLTIIAGASRLPPATYNLQPRDIVRLCFENPNRIFGLGKDGITEGARADIIVVDPKAEWEIHASELHSKCRWSPYDEWHIKGRVERVITPPQSTESPSVPDRACDRSTDTER